MDRYDRVMNDVLQKTNEESLAWRAVNAERYSEIVLNTWRVIRAFAADFLVGGTNYHLVFVDKKIDVHDDLGDYASEGRAFQLLVLDENEQLVLNLYEGVVDRDDLLRLAGLIDEHNNLARKFFEAFDHPGAA